MPGIVEMNVPVEMKPCQPYLQRANELRQRDLFMAYQCELYAAQLGYKLLEQSPGKEAEQFLTTILDDLEAMKAELNDHPAVHDDHASSKYVLEFALRVFAAADEQERQGEVNKYSFLFKSSHINLYLGKRRKCSWRPAISLKY